MENGLPAGLVAETRATLESLSRIRLPQDAWPSVRENLSRAGYAVNTANSAALRDALDKLHQIGLEVPSRDDAPEIPTAWQKVGWFGGNGSIWPGKGPEISSVAAQPSEPKDERFKSSNSDLSAASAIRGSSRHGRRLAWIAVLTVGLGLAAVLLFFLVESRSDAPKNLYPGTVTTSPERLGGTTESPSPGTTSPPLPVAEHSSGAALAIAGGLLAVAIGVLITVVVFMRRRSRKSYAPMHIASVPDPSPTPLVLTPAPEELLELANRMVDTLVG